MSESDISDYEEADDVDLGRLTGADVDRVRKRLSDKCTAVNDYLLSSREPVEKRRLVGNALQDLLNAFNQVSAAYLQLHTSTLAAGNLKSTLKKTVHDQVKAALKDLLPSPTAIRDGVTYSEAANGARSLKTDLRKVKVSNGPTVVIPSSTSVVIGPKADKAREYASAEATRKAVMKAVIPSKVNLKVNRMVNTRNNAVRIIADSIDIDKLKTSTDLAAAGLEVKVKEKLNPRLVIRGVPIDITNADLLADICTLNFDGELPPESVKLVYRYPPRANQSVASVVIETNPDARRRLLSQGRVFLPWQACKVEDHLRLLQCYKCQGFGHLAKGCSSTAICGICAGAHDTASCTSSGTAPKCHNCVEGKNPNSDHKAFDASKCPIIKRRLTEKARNICY